jgi:hypothetical protein
MTSQTKIIRYNLNVPYSEKDEAKALGARWDPSIKNGIF